MTRKSVAIILIFIALLGQATSSGKVVLDLEDGYDYWKTRLLVLLPGIEWLGKSDKRVIVTTEKGKENCFQGLEKQMNYCSVSFNRTLIIL